MVEVLSPIEPGRWPNRALAVVVVLATMALMVVTEPRLAIVWDEGFTLGREARIRSWFRAMADPPWFAAQWSPPSPGSELVQSENSGVAPQRIEIDSRAKLLSPRVIAWFWPFAREEPHGHPPFYAVEGLVGDWLAPGWPPLARARIGPMLAFSLTAGAIFGFMSRRWGRWSASLATSSWILQPNLFGHGHYATVDALLTSLWVGGLLAFGTAVETDRRNPRWAWAILFGVLCGWAADTKLTGWFLPIPFLAWTLLYRDRRGFLTLVLGGLVAVVVLFAFNPCWWGDPVSGLARFFRSNLTRGRTIPIPVAFLGQIYQTPNESLPWYNTLAWTLMVTPVGFLALALVGAVRVVVRSWRDRGHPARFASLAAIHWAFLLALRSMPHTPGHDGVRLFLPAFGVLAVVSGLGASALLARFGRWGKVAVVTAILEGALSVLLLMPTPVSYFSPVVGGLRGAAKLGMEPTYFWDGLSDEALNWLNEHTPPDRSVRFSSFPTSWLYLKQQGKLRANLWPIDRGEPRWYVLQNRPGAWNPHERALFRDARPAFQSENQGVPLVLIYPLPD